VDGDGFSRATRLGRTVAAGVISAATDEAPFDGFSTAQLIDHFAEASGGVVCLPRVLEILADLGSQPLLLVTRVDEGLEHVNEAAHGPACGMLDLQPGLVAQSAARSRTVEMYRRYAEEIQRFLSAARPKLQPRAARSAKEVDRDLFAAAR
jgi:hypothetical protein